MHRGQSDASRERPRCSRRPTTTSPASSARPAGASIAVTERDRGDQRGDVFAADRVPRRRQRRHHDDGAQLELRALAWAVPRDPAAVRAARRVPAGALRPGDRRARPRAPGLADRLAHQAGLLHWSVELPRHEESLAAVRAWPMQRLRAAGRRAALAICWSTRAQLVPGSSSTCSSSAPTTWRSRSTRCWRRSASACCTPGSICSSGALPFLYGGDMIAEGRVFPDHVDYNELPWKYAAGTPNILGTIVSAQALRLLLDLALRRNRPALLRHRPADRAGRGADAHDPRGRTGTGCSRARALDGLAAIPGATVYGPP